MSLKLNTAPTVEPISLAVAKAHLRSDSEDLADDLDVAPSIVPGDHAIAASYSLEGESLLVSGYSTIVYLIPGGNGSGGTVDVKLQESQDEITWSDVTDGAFTQVTEENDDADDTQEKAYTGSYSYLRAVSTVAVATCDFGVVFARKAGPTIEDDLLTALIKTARVDCENFQNRAYITQTWELWLDEWPDNGYIEIPKPPLQEPSVSAGSFVTGTVYRILSVGTTVFTDIGASENTVGVCFKATGAGSGTGTATKSGIITYYGTDDTAYYADGIFMDNKDQYSPKLCLKYGESWPSTTLRPHIGICITFICGYGDAASNVPEYIKQAMLLLIGHLYEHREDVITGITATRMPLASQYLLSKERVMPV